MSLESRLTSVVVIKTFILQPVIIANYYIGVLFFTCSVKNDMSV